MGKMCDDLQTFFLQSRYQRTVISGVLGLGKTVCFIQDRIDLFLGGHTGYICLCITGIYLVFQRSHTDHEKFVQIGSGYT